jgi:hypothetical protein
MKLSFPAEINDLDILSPLPWDEQGRTRLFLPSGKVHKVKLKFKSDILCEKKRSDKLRSI